MERRLIRGWEMRMVLTSLTRMRTQRSQRAMLKKSRDNRMKIKPLLLSSKTMMMRKVSKLKASSCRMQACKPTPTVQRSLKLNLPQLKKRGKREKTSLGDPRHAPQYKSKKIQARLKTMMWSISRACTFRVRTVVTRS